MTLPADIDFDAWLQEMPRALETFLRAVPDAIATQLDYSAASLEVLEKWLLASFASLATFQAPDARSLYDGGSRYVGEVFRRHLGGSWDLDRRKRSPFYGLPILFETRSLGTACPHTLLSTSFDRNTGTFMRSVLTDHA
jgi:hypothetical protein